MSAWTSAASHMTRSWVAMYTLGLASTVRESRRREIASDLWEHQHDAAREGSNPLGTALHIISRMLRGLPADVFWRINMEGRPRMTSILLQSTLPNPTYRGKVRDTYDLGERMLIVATDRISAFDLVLPTGIPDKGKVLSGMSAWWFDRTKDVVPNHLTRIADGTAADELPFELPAELIGRTTIARKAKRIDVECIVRGYITGSAWAEYQKWGTVNGVRMEKGLVESQQLPEPMFTPTTKAEEGHDEPMTFSDLVQEVGPQDAQILRLRSIALYNFAAAYARERGIIIADTKFEFGYIDGEITVIDEILTPDSSRFWDASVYQAGQPQPSFDKQYVRDWLANSGWNKEPPAPELPPDVVQGTSERYKEAYRRLTGMEVK